MFPYVQGKQSFSQSEVVLGLTQRQEGNYSKIVSTKKSISLVVIAEVTSNIFMFFIVAFNHNLIHETIYYHHL
jgi:hypothetical protein